MDAQHSAAAKLRRGRPFSQGHDPRRNAGGRPKGLVALIRQATNDGQDLVNLLVGIARADKRVLGGQQVALRDRLRATELLLMRGWGQPVVVDADIEPETTFDEVVEQIAAALPENLRHEVAEALTRAFTDQIDREVAEAVARGRAQMPTPVVVKERGNGGGPAPDRE